MKKSVYLEVERVTAMQSFTELRTAYEFDETLCEYPIENLRFVTRRQAEAKVTSKPTQTK